MQANDIATKFAADRNPVGRPKLDLADFEEELLSRLMDGETIPTICNDPHMPSRAWLSAHRRRDPAFNDRIQMARRAGMDMNADLFLDIGLGGRYSSGDVNRDRLAMEALKWVMGKRAPAEFGERIVADGGTVILLNAPTSSDDGLSF